jgi:chromosome partitioning protein
VYSAPRVMTRPRSTVVVRRPCTVHRMRTLAVVNQKGGVGKTTVAINLAAALAQLDQRVLLVDLDPQGDATTGFGFEEHYEAEVPSLLAALTGRLPAGTAVADLIVGAGPMDLLPSNLDLALAERLLLTEHGREHLLGRRVLSGLAERYDWCLIDCPPSLGVLTDNAIVAAGEVLVVIKPEGKSLRALGLLLDQIGSLRQGLDVTAEDDTRVARRVDEDLAALPVPVLGRIRKRVVVDEAWEQHRTVLDYEPDGHAAEAFRELAHRLAATVPASSGASA